MGVKIDAVPGRLNGVRVYVGMFGVLYGQCREFCGSDHAFIPIVLEFVMVEDFIQWLNGEVIPFPNGVTTPPPLNPVRELLEAFAIVCLLWVILSNGPSLRDLIDI
jgi:hypothetical protein